MEGSDTSSTTGPCATDAALAPVVARAGYMMGDHPEKEWTAEHAVAWEGFLELARRMRRDAETVLERDHDLSISMVGIMGRLMRAPKQTLRQTDLACAMDLSLSRVSRVIDVLERRELVERQSCPSDARATNVKLTRAGRTATAAAQRSVYGLVQSSFTDRLSPDEITVLARVFSRLIAEG